MLIGQETVLPGSTSVDVTAPVLFGAHLRPSGEMDDSFEKRLQEVTAAAKFMDAAGTIVKAISHPEPDKGIPGGAKKFIIKPEAPLQADRWYTLVIEETDRLLVGNLGGDAGRPRSTWKSHFFTGSFPHVVRLMRTTKDPFMLRVTFSEPVDLSTVDPSTLVRLGGQRIGTGSPTAAGFMSEEVNLRLTTSLAENLKDAITLQLDSRVKGSGRTVGEAAAMAGRALKSENSHQVLEDSIAPGDWFGCEEGAAYCWQRRAP